MSSQRDIEQTLHGWLADGPTEINDRIVESALDVIEHTDQRRVLRVPRWRNLAMTMPMRLAGAAALVAVILIGGVLVLRPASTGVGTSPSPTASPAFSTAPTAAAPATNMFAGATQLSGSSATVAGITYYDDTFSPGFEIRPGAGWFIDNNFHTLVSLQSGPGSPSRTPTYVIQVLVPAKVVEQGTAGPIKAPTDLIGWLRARTDLSLSAPTSVTIDGIQGQLISFGLRSGAAVNPEGGVNLICSAESECGYEGGQLVSIGPAGHLTIVDLDVRGSQVVIALRAPAANSAADQKLLNDVLMSFVFPTSP